MKHCTCRWIQRLPPRPQAIGARLGSPPAENAVLSYAEKGTTDEASVRRRDINKLREAEFSDKDVLLIAGDRLSQLHDPYGGGF